MDRVEVAAPRDSEFTGQLNNSSAASSLLMPTDPATTVSQCSCEPVIRFPIVIAWKGLLGASASGMFDINLKRQSCGRVRWIRSAWTPSTCFAAS